MKCQLCNALISYNGNHELINFFYLFFNSYYRVQKVTMKYSEKSITQNGEKERELQSI